MTSPKIKVHPVADLFPMLGEEDLQELANSIAEEGLLDPIVLDAEGRILDGRNRYAACKLAKVDPEYVDYEGDDPDTYALVVNIARRHMNKGSLAMVAAKAFLELQGAQRLSRWRESGLTHEEMANRVGVSESMVTYAATVFVYAPELVDAVINGASLNGAYNFAHQRKLEADNAERSEAERQAREEKLALKYEEKLERERESIRRTLEDIGPAVALPTIPPREEDPEVELPTEVDSGPSADDLKKVKSYLDSLIGVRNKLSQLSLDAPTSPVLAEWLSHGSYSALTQIVALAAEIAEKCNVNMKDQKKLRSVK